MNLVVVTTLIDILGVLALGVYGILLTFVDVFILLDGTCLCVLV